MVALRRTLEPGYAFDKSPPDPRDAGRSPRQFRKSVFAPGASRTRSFRFSFQPSVWAVSGTCERMRSRRSRTWGPIAEPAVPALIRVIGQPSGQQYVHGDGCPSTRPDRPGTPRGVTGTGRPRRGLQEGPDFARPGRADCGPRLSLVLFVRASPVSGDETSFVRTHDRTCGLDRLSDAGADWNDRMAARRLGRRRGRLGKSKAGWSSASTAWTVGRSRPACCSSCAARRRFQGARRDSDQAICDWSRK